MRPFPLPDLHGLGRDVLDGMIHTMKDIIDRMASDHETQISELVQRLDELVKRVEYGTAKQGDRLRIADERVKALECALREIIVEKCCGCSVYREIAQSALGMTDDEVKRMRDAPSYDVPEPDWSERTRGSL